MATTSTNDPNTVILGSSKSVMEGTDIILYYSKTLPEGYRKISVYTIKDILSYILDINNKVSYIKLSRVNIEDYYKYEFSDKLSGFDTIIYINSDNTPTGFSEFSTIQGETKNINIFPNITTKVTKTDRTLDNSLSSERAENKSKNFLGDELYEYPSAEKIKNNLPEVRNLYTSHLTDVINNNKVINLTYGFVDENGISTIKLNKKIDPDLHKVNFYNYLIGHHCESLSLLEFKEFSEDDKIYFNKKNKQGTENPDDYSSLIYNEDEKLDCYNIISLTETNKFGGTLQYIKLDKITSNFQGVNRVRRYNDDPTLYEQIIGFSGKYLRLNVIDQSGNSMQKLYNFSTLEYVNTPDNAKFILDEWAINPEIIYYTDKLNFREVVNKVPSILNCYYKKLEELFLQTGSLEFYKKVGNWNIFSFSKLGKILYICIGAVSSITITEEEINNIIFINDISFLLKENDYYVLYNGYNKNYKSERALQQSTEGGNLTTVKINNVDIIINSNTDINTYSKNDINIILKSSDLYSSKLNEYRKNSYPYEIKGIPEIIGACEGIIYYKYKNYINYL